MLRRYLFDITIANQVEQDIKTGVGYAVCDTTSADLSTIYDDGGNAKTNPVEEQDYVHDGGRIHFYSESIRHDIYIVARNSSTTLEDIVAQQYDALPTRRIKMMEPGSRHGLLAWPFAVTAEMSTAETKIGVTMPRNAVITGCNAPWLYLYAAASTNASIALGLWAAEPGGDADGLICGQSLSTGGIKFPHGHLSAALLVGDKRGALIFENVQSAWVEKAIATQGGVLESLSITADTKTDKAKGIVVVPYEIVRY